MSRGRRRLATAAFAVLALSTVVLPWYALDDYVPNGIDATAWAQAALGLALAALVVLRLERTPPLVLSALALAALACVLVRLIWPPDFGFGFDGLVVPVARRAGVWVAFGAALTGAGVALASRT